ncbi:Penicillinase repressor [Novipirellula aureliae]|uniref:Penicillinase repressor n=1 Tax=Novipirellula aureliae TaxID=2527966 RepID=A0A5C6D9L6_9BACT|nr:BlaI/MecI/CopY family transcriptional regulator [Novipirellula aureliae]TWU33602.1 Penicillinase repressor [Novipirellula aureliae]
MARPVSSQPTEAELAILKILWKQGQATTREIYNGLSADRETNDSTTVHHCG